MKNQESFDYPIGQWPRRIDGRFTNLHGFVTGHLFSDKIMRMCGDWEEELVKEIGGNK